MIQENVERFFSWINERQKIFRAKEAGAPWPWTADPILQKYKFTNAFREQDRTTVWFRENITKPNEHQPLELQLFNCCLFRMFGTMEFGEVHKFVTNFNPSLLKQIARARLRNGKKVFTGAYIITNQGLRLPKEEVVVDKFLTPIWELRFALAKHAEVTNSLEQMHKALSKQQGWGGGGFMAYEAVTDMNYTPVLREAVDKYTWANAGPGAKRGLNRLHGRPLNETPGRRDWNKEMQDLLAIAPYYLALSIMPHGQVDMRMIEHSLCEFDKYCRVLNNEGKPRSLYHGGS